MALKSRNRNHIEKAQLLKQLRKESGLTQEELSARIGLRRDFVSHIENCHLQQMEALRVDLEDKWWEVCKTSTTQKARDSWRRYILRKIGI